MKKILYLSGCLYIYLIFGAVIAISTHSIGNIFFVWNVFLALLPLLFARLLTSYLGRQKRSRAVALLLAFLWLLFFPNAPYMITDLIHMGGSGYFNGFGSGATYTTNIRNWAFLVYVASGVIFAALLGLRSQYDVHRLVIARFGKPLGAVFMAAVCLLSGFGIYIGRILRFNSWDVLRPFSLLVLLKENLSSFSILFSLLFSVYIAVSYIAFYIVITAGSGSVTTDELR